MYCSNCGSKVSDDSKFCSQCGQQTARVYIPDQRPSLKYYFKDVRFRNSSEYVKTLFSQAEKMQTIGIATFASALVCNLAVAPLFPWIYMLTIPALIVSIIFDIKTIQLHRELKKLYLEYLNQNYSQPYR